jgi:ectoine hydroxylase-related dioxygenase (phytanoyl-CoA dioxygenase family)
LLKNGEMLNFWLPLTAVNHINGCLHYVPGSHKAGKRYHGPEFGDKGPLIVLDYGDAERAIEVSVHVEPGDLLVHHGFMLHCSEANRSAEERCALGFPYILQKEVRQTVAEWNLGLQH